MMSSRKLRMGQGKVVTGQSFWNREAEMKLFVDRIDEGAHQLLVAQRRMGKTSLMAEAADRLQDRYICLFVDVQKCYSEPDAIVELSLKVHSHAGLWDKAKRTFSNILDRLEGVQIGELGVTLRSGLNAGNWKAKGDQLLEILSASAKPVIILFDEVPILVNRLLKSEAGKITPEGRNRADAFMSWLRQNSIQHQNKIRLVLSGSIGLAPVLHQARLSATINNFTPLEIGGWDKKTATGCINALATQYGLELDEGVPERMIEKLGYSIPHHVQMFFSYVHERCTKRETQQCTLEDADEVYETKMLGVRGHIELAHYEERLEQVLDPEACTLAFDMLAEAAVVGRLTSEALLAFQKEYPLEGRDAGKEQKNILWVLEHDGYLQKEDQGYVFVSKLLRNWWKNRYQQSYRAVQEREPQK